MLDGREGADINKASFKNALVQWAYFAQAEGDEISFCGARLRGSFLVDMTARTAFFGTQCRDAVGSTSVGAGMLNVKLKGSDLEKATFCGAEFLETVVIDSATNLKDATGADAIVNNEYDSLPCPDN